MTVANTELYKKNIFKMGQLIKKKRIEYGISTKFLATVANTDVSTLQKLENQHAPTSIEVLERFIVALEFTKALNATANLLDDMNEHKKAEEMRKPRRLFEKRKMQQLLNKPIGSFKIIHPFAKRK